MYFPWIGYFFLFYNPDTTTGVNKTGEDQFPHLRWMETSQAKTRLAFVLKTGDRKNPVNS
jgi:hypothetical protein